MSEINFTDRFCDIMIHEAACDRFLRGTLEWLLLGKTDKVNRWFLNDVDEGELLADIAEYYALSPEDTEKAFDLCEVQILEEAKYG